MGLTLGVSRRKIAILQCIRGEGGEYAEGFCCNDAMARAQRPILNAGKPKARPISRTSADGDRRNLQVLGQGTVMRC